MAADVWSLGVTVAELFTEEDAWCVDDVIDSVNAIKDKMKKKTPPNILNILSHISFVAFLKVIKLLW
jgi:hypothetical protein